MARVVVPAPAAATAAPPVAQAAPAAAPAPVSTPAWEDPPAVAKPAAPVAAQPAPASPAPASVTPPVTTPAPAAARAPEPPAQPEPPDDMQYDAGDAGYDMPDDGPPPDYDGGYEPAGFDDYRPVPDSAHPISREAVLPAATGSVVAVPAASALAAAAGESPIELKGEWHALAARLPVTGLAAELARQSEWAGVRGRLITLRVAARALADTPGRERLRQALAEHFGGHVQLEVQFGETGDGTAHAVAQAEIAARQQAAETIIHEDPFVQALMRDFGAHIVQGTIRPVNIPPAA
ncbi:DNA polymerase III subunits gamma and tau [plant metagenome]|uniref:DNA polymerase III subunits gamma and tau n=1 Tax=plant metagenome TaxID=1297885 RepID=A0A484S2Y5_9ZZZZ